MKLTNLDRRWLSHFAKGGRETPYGMGPVGVFNFVTQRRWLVRIERDKPFGPEVYRLTALGVQIYEQSLIDQ